MSFVLVSRWLNVLLMLNWLCMLLFVRFVVSLVGNVSRMFVLWLNWFSVVLSGLVGMLNVWCDVCCVVGVVLVLVLVSVGSGSSVDSRIVLVSWWVRWFGVVGCDVCGRWWVGVGWCWYVRWMEVMIGELVDDGLVLFLWFMLCEYWEIV